MQMFKLGLIINPIAGIGGSVALKGSDGEGMVEKALALGAQPKAGERTKMALEILLPYKQQIKIYCADGQMGAQCAADLGFNCETVYHSINSQVTTAQDTENAVQAIAAHDVDILLFAGGDGTARNISHQLGETLPVLGIPAGCKIHSGVYAVTPKAAGRVIELMLSNQLVTLTSADVMDIDESLFRRGTVKAKRYGEMQVPSELRYMQAVKSGGKESDELVLQDIADDLIEKMDELMDQEVDQDTDDGQGEDHPAANCKLLPAGQDQNMPEHLCEQAELLFSQSMQAQLNEHRQLPVFIIGSGSTTAFVMQTLGLDNTLLGVDLIHNQCLLCSDITEPVLWQFIQCHKNLSLKLVITLIGGQGHIFGRGNQQLSPRIIRAIGKQNILIIATKTKLTALNSRPLIVDTGDSELDKALSGFMPVTTGYKDQVLYPVASPE